MPVGPQNPASVPVSSHIRPVDLVAMPGGPHPIPFRTRSLSLPGPMVLRLKARESRSPPGLLDGCKKTHKQTTPKGRQTLHQRNHRAPDPQLKDLRTIRL